MISTLPTGTTIPVVLSSFVNFLQQKIFGVILSSTKVFIFLQRAFVS